MVCLSVEWCELDREHVGITTVELSTYGRNAGVEPESSSACLCDTLVDLSEALIGLVELRGELAQKDHELLGVHGLDIV